MLISLVFGALALLSLAIGLWQFLVARSFPLHQRVADARHTPPVTLLKPLKGCDAETAVCLRSWLSQNYSGPVQVLFGVESEADPACAVVRELLLVHAASDAQLVICGESLGANAKVSTLIQLQRQARHDTVVVSDADVRVPADFLANVVAPLADPQVGLVNCFYCLANPSTLAMRSEAVAVNADFWSQVLQSQSLKPLDFALGAVMATRRTQLEAIGGFVVLADYLADDYQLGHLIARQGHRIALCPVVAECWEAPQSWTQVWKHQLRWARTIRVCQPAPFFFSIISNATLWPLVWLLMQPTLLVLAAASFCWLVRLITAQIHQVRLTRSTSHLAYVWLVPVKDLLAVIVWALAFIGRQVEWRGRRYRVLTGGKLVTRTLF